MGSGQRAESRKIQSFTDLNAWKNSHRLVISIYKVTKQFPEEEKFGLTSQMRRAGVSVTSNIAEGFSRRSEVEKNRFYNIALASLTELQSQLLIARDIMYLSVHEFNEIAEVALSSRKLLIGLTRSIEQAKREV